MSEWKRPGACRRTIAIWQVNSVMLSRRRVDAGKVFIHLGDGKAGSSSIQAGLDVYSKLVEWPSGLAVLTSDDTNTIRPRLNDSESATINSFVWGIQMASNEERQNQYCVFSEILISLSSERSIILSAENLMSIAIQDLDSFLHAVARIAEHREITFLFVERDPEQFASSAFRQWGHRSGDSFTEYVTRILGAEGQSRRSSIATALCSLGKYGDVVLGHIDTVAAVAEGADLDSVFARFLQSSGFALGSCSDIKLPRRNASMSPELLAMLGGLKRVPWENKHDNRTLSSIQHYLTHALGLNFARNSNFESRMMNSLRSYSRHAADESNVSDARNELLQFDEICNPRIPGPLISDLGDELVRASLELVRLQELGIVSNHVEAVSEGIHSMDQRRIWTSLNRRNVSRHLRGSGVEIGPGVDPFPLGGLCTNLVYVEKHYESGYAQIHDLQVTELVLDWPVVVGDMDTDSLAKLVNTDIDFVIASHVLEHLANPIRALREIQMTLSDSGVTLIALPDLRYTFDRNREPVSLEHLVEEFRSDVRIVDRDHIHECLSSQGLSSNVDELTTEIIEQYQYESVHAHAWTWLDFVSSLIGISREIDVNWCLIDLTVPECGYGNTNEFIVVLSKSPSHSPEELACQILDFVAQLTIGDSTKAKMASLLMHAVTDRSADPIWSLPEADQLIWALYCLWRSRSDLCNRFPHPIVDPAAMLNWVVSNQQYENDARLIIKLLAE